ncbi:TPA: DUF5444 family protein [Yersinia enterocolitica]|nr:DUF5444 family protein [Yersinia enterocolitica]HDL7593575.1 DUF5444 family protein [Yersinia enterocolitica]HEN3564011.1 DUF5444 family protein [Yersinia enterocolitica]
MRIKPNGDGTVTASQVHNGFKNRYTKSFPDTAKGIHDAYLWCRIIWLGWDDLQDMEYAA